MKIPYRRLDEYQPVDIAKLRPGTSYKDLVARRTHPVDELVRQHGRIPEHLLASRACPTCGSTDAKHELDKDHLTLVRCASCDLVYTNPTFDEAHYREVYASQDYQDIVRDLGIQSHEYRVQRFGEERVRLMTPHLPVFAKAASRSDATNQRQFVRPASGPHPADEPAHSLAGNGGPPPAPRYLDVGCSTGFVVEAARTAGWDAIGIDLNPSALEFGRGRGLDLREASLEDTGFAPASFDAISLFDVLEHLLDPVRTLRACTSLLRTGGIVFLYVPNYDSASRLLMGKDAHFIWPTHHLNYYTPATITDLMTREGLETVYLATEGLDVVDYLWYRREVQGATDDAVARLADVLQFFVNAGAYGKNLRVIARKRA